MTLTAPAPTLPLFATVDHEPALEFPVPFDDGEWVVEGDVPFSVEQRRETARDATAAPMREIGRVAVEGAPPEPEGRSAVGSAASEGAPPEPECGSAVGSAVDEDAVVASGAVSPAVREPPTPARNGTDGSHAAAGPSDGRLRRERERALLARRRAELVVRTALEVLDGRRPVNHLAPFAAPEVLRYVNAGIPRRGRTAAAGASLRSLHVSLPGRAAAEVAAVCRFGTRVRALAARLELTGQGEWRCVALRVI
ncbi:hypothetical protein GCM10010472_63930 [Pseudonocardia halophobica]|uniref:Alanine, arginine and proline rich protein n=1 Tax=Pseudonocardia halophobica TaxID=29401 RepID=A0A9W6P1I7_9PSEU|nr:Rv3235 family protein [Pseudonocardia halophobica]GLL16075.1 hypothetical protein GCM10017577_72300 [Pseudonocardia halophobica]